MKTSTRRSNEGRQEEKIRETKERKENKILDGKRKREENGTVKEASMNRKKRNKILFSVKSKNI